MPHDAQAPAPDPKAVAQYERALKRQKAANADLGSFRRIRDGKGWLVVRPGTRLVGIAGWRPAFE